MKCSIYSESGIAIFCLEKRKKTRISLVFKGGRQFSLASSWFVFNCRLHKIHLRATTSACVQFCKIEKLLILHILAKKNTTSACVKLCIYAQFFFFFWLRGYWHLCAIVTVTVHMHGYCSLSIYYFINFFSLVFGYTHGYCYSSIYYFINFFSLISGQSLFFSFFLSSLLLFPSLSLTPHSLSALTTHL